MIKKIEYVHRGKLVQCPEPGFDHVLRTCKRRNCPRCGVHWARDWRRVMAINLAAKHGPVVLVSITAPGEERLPWDEAHCGHRRRHRHRGPSGCRVQQRAAREWADTATWRWARLRNAARLAAQRAGRNEATGELGAAPSLLERVWEPQKRGVPHLHLVLGFATGAERQAARAFVDELKRLAHDYDFGFVDGRLEPITAEDASRYLSSYLTGRNSKHKGSIRENVADPVMPRSLIWLTPALTSTSTSSRIAAMRERLRVARGTGVTMRMLRKARHLWAARQGRATPPQWRTLVEAIDTVSVYLQAFQKRPPPDLAPAHALAAKISRNVWRTTTWALFLPQATGLAFELVELSFPAAA